MANAELIKETIELLKKEKDLARLFQEMPDWKIFQLVSLAVTNYERVEKAAARRKNG